MSQVEVQKIEDHTTSLAIAAAVICVLLTLLIVWLKRRFIRRASTVLIVGLNDAGKTILFSKLINQGHTPHTYSSLKENVYDGFMDAAGNELTLVDFPGAERLRKQLFTNYFQQRRSNLRGILFMVDSATFSKRARDVAEFLYDVLYESAKKVSVLVACNKQDISLAKSSQAIRSALEREFGLINGTREAALESTAGDSKKRILTDTGRNFQWKDLHSPRIEFLECCVAPQHESGESVDLEGIQKWVNSL
uniref:Signal recognition particle receptor subunit beta n=2 Tax=Ascaris TaxID=6251 RepID=A0A0M3I9S4_ASCLU